MNYAAPDITDEDTFVIERTGERFKVRVCPIGHSGLWNLMFEQTGEIERPVTGHDTVWLMEHEG